MHRDLPWRKPRHELALLALVAAAALLPMYPLTSQDQSRLCLSNALVHLRLSADECLASTFDKAVYGGHLYSDKPPGMSVLELPAMGILRLQPIDDVTTTSARLWGVRLLTSGLAFLVCAFLVGRVAEGLSAGTGGAALVAFALGTLVWPLAATSFGHVVVAAFAFGAFLLAWRGSPLGAGLLAGGAFLLEYQAAVVAVALAVYVAVRSGRAVGRFALGVLPGAALLAAYDTAAFGRPWRVPYRYIDNGWLFDQRQGLFGIRLPRVHSTFEVFAGGGGLLVVSPILVMAAVGLFHLGRACRVEAITAGAIAATFVLIDCGYFLPYGGVSPGPRFLVPGLPFLALGLGPAFNLRPRLCSLLTVLSVVPMAALMLVWSTNPPLHGTVWAELWRVVEQGGSSRIVRNITPTAPNWLGLGRTAGAVPIVLAAGCALALALRGLPLGRAARSRVAAAAAAVALALVAAADAAAVAGFPYGVEVATTPADLTATLTASRVDALPGDEVDYVATVANGAAGIVSGVRLDVALAPGMLLLGAPAYTRGSGCTGTTRLDCFLDYLTPEMSTSVRFGVRIEPGASGNARVSVWPSSNGDRGPGASAVVDLGSG
jgi:hypothetical protein